MRGNGPSDIRERQTPGSQDQKPERDNSRGSGKLTVVGLGPGDPQYLAPKARIALDHAEVIVGYKTYVDLMEPELLQGKEIVTTGMTGEIRRCRIAIEKALEGRDVVIVSSGDAGIYGMAGLSLELLAKQGLIGSVKVEVIPGIPALSAAAALLGAPLMHDFAVISLSDLMTPWETIEARVEASAKADFVMVIYNPGSKKRDWQLSHVRETVLKHRDGHTPVGIVRNATREGESVEITFLSEMDHCRVDMLSILIIGNSRTRVLSGKMITPRGYMDKYGDKKKYEG